MKRVYVRTMMKTLMMTAIAVLYSATALRAQANSCAQDPQVRQLDYWLGDWTVTNPGSSASNTSSVTASLDRCLFVENWRGQQGHAGEDVFAYSAEDRNWYGMFADNEGRAHVFTKGTVAGGSAEFEGTSGGPHGEVVLNRVKLVRTGPGKVEETWEKSTDNGTSWKMAFRGEYSRTRR